MKVKLKPGYYDKQIYLSDLFLIILLMLFVVVIFRGAEKKRMTNGKEGDYSTVTEQPVNHAGN